MCSYSMWPLLLCDMMTSNLIYPCLIEILYLMYASDKFLHSSCSLCCLYTPCGFYTKVWLAVGLSKCIFSYLLPWIQVLNWNHLSPHSCCTGITPLLTAAQLESPISSKLPVFFSHNNAVIWSAWHSVKIPDINQKMFVLPAVFQARCGSSSRGRCYCKRSLYCAPWMDRHLEE